MKQFEKYLPYLLFGAGLYAVYKLFDLGGKGVTALNEAGSAVGSSLYDFFHKDEMGETKFYTATFPDGMRHAIPASIVNADGFFRNSVSNPLYKADGKSYRLMVARNHPTALPGTLVAVLV